MDHEYEYVSDIPGVYAERTYDHIGWDTVDPEDMIRAFTEALDTVDPETMTEDYAECVVGAYKFDVDLGSDFDDSIIYTLNVEINGQEFCWSDVYLSQAKSDGYWDYNLSDFAYCFQLALQGLIGMCQEHI
jgi:hypothetical protein